MTNDQRAIEVIESEDFQRFRRDNGRRRWLFWREPLDIPFALVRDIIDFEDDAQRCVWQAQRERAKAGTGVGKVPTFAARLARGCGIDPLTIVSLVMLVLKATGRGKAK